MFKSNVGWLLQKLDQMLGVRRFQDPYNILVFKQFQILKLQQQSQFQQIIDENYTSLEHNVLEDIDQSFLIHYTIPCSYQYNLQYGGVCYTDMKINYFLLFFFIFRALPPTNHRRVIIFYLLSHEFIINEQVSELKQIQTQLRRMKEQHKQNNSTFPTALPNETFGLAGIKEIEGEVPYYMDGDTQMYTAENMEKRKQLFYDPQIQKQLAQFVNLYKFSKGQLNFVQYKKVHEKIAKNIRPNIDKDELDFLVKEDFDYDSSDGPITEQRLKKLLFDMVDVWTTSINKQQYLKFIKQLRDKIK